MKITGFAFAWLLCILFCIETYRLLVRTGTKGKSICFSIFYILSGFINFTAIIGIINSYYRRKIKIPSNLRKSIPKLIAAEDIVFFAVIFIFLAIALFFFLRHLKVKGEWENPAQHRILRRYERDCRRIGAFAFILGLLVLLDCTVIKKKANRLVELSPSEEFQIDGNRIYIPLEQVSDGHLHRFSWTNEKGKTIRFIIVQKRGTNFGVGFDACEVCGNVGYYERKNEIVCNRCDVVMNKNTIGLKGGCNPIPLESKIEDGGIVIYTQNLNLEAGRF
ncbi:MAG: Fe-S-containing protein [Treponema sp.]|nr:Fe-S-containing protein [Treponema sp.]